MTDMSWEGSKLYIDDRALSLPHRVALAVVVGDVVAVLYDPDASPGSVGVFENLVGLDLDGAVAWTAPVPTAGTGDCYVDLHEDLGQLSATSWSGWRVRIDPRTGAIVDREFVK